MTRPAQKLGTSGQRRASRVGPLHAGRPYGAALTASAQKVSMSSSVDDMESVEDMEDVEDMRNMEVIDDRDYTEDMEDRVVRNFSSLHLCPCLFLR